MLTLSLHDALPILAGNLVVTEKSATPTKCVSRVSGNQTESGRTTGSGNWTKPFSDSIKNWFNIITQLSRSEEHTSELQSRGHLVCRLLLEKKKYYQVKVNVTEEFEGTVKYEFSRSRAVLNDNKSNRTSKTRREFELSE